MIHGNAEGTKTWAEATRPGARPPKPYGRDGRTVKPPEGHAWASPAVALTELLARCSAPDLAGCRAWSDAPDSSVPKVSLPQGRFPVRRMLWESAHGEQLHPRDRVRLTCTNPACVEVSHLRVARYKPAPPGANPNKRTLSVNLSREEYDAFFKFVGVVRFKRSLRAAIDADKARSPHTKH